MVVEPIGMLLGLGLLLDLARVLFLVIHELGKLSISVLGLPI